MTIHFVYVQGNGVGTPFAITNELAKRLEVKYRVIVYDWAEKTTIYPVPGDILLGHAHPLKNTVLRRSFNQNGWHKKVLLCPFAHAMPEYIAFLDELVCYADKYLAICGPYWTKTIEDSLFAHWKNKIERIDLAINRSHFPFIKKNFNPPGQRKFVTIGRLGKNKGSDYYASIADEARHLSFSWIGGNIFSENSHVTAVGALDFKNNSAVQKLAEFDFVIQCGRSDANPTTLLEGASVGLIPICTPQSGYDDTPWIKNIPLNNINETINILNDLNNTPESLLQSLQLKAQVDLDSHYNWERFTSQVLFTLEEPPLEHQDKGYQGTSQIQKKLSDLASDYEQSLNQELNTSIFKKIVSKIKSKIQAR
jgi:glycosyltransferase involved in cell wall biosynthesis